MYRLALIFVVLALILVCATALADVPRQESAVPTVSYNPETYCGIYSLYLAGRSLGFELKFNDLLKPQYISSRQGSSLSDLILAAKEQHLYSEPMGRMNCNVLRYAQCPVILHIKNDLATAKEYNHWVLFAGTEEGKARIHDGARPMELMDFTDLAARWDGVGLLVDKSPISTSSLWLAVVAPFIFYAGASTAVIALLLWLQLRWVSERQGASWSRRLWFRSAHELALLIVLASVLGIGCRWVHAGGFLSAPQAVAAVQDMHLGGFLPKVKVEGVPKLLGAEGVTIVDARFPHDFAAGHLADAINIPPHSSPEQCQKSLAGVSTSIRILLYCQSNGCPYSEIVARKLIALGYSNILYFRDGWIAWEKYQQKTAP